MIGVCAYRRNRVREVHAALETKREMELLTPAVPEPPVLMELAGMARVHENDDTSPTGGELLEYAGAFEDAAQLLVRLRGLLATIGPDPDDGDWERRATESELQELRSQIKRMVDA